VPEFTCSFQQQPQPFPHFWEHTVGSGHAPLALRADWQTQMLRCHNELGFQHVRFHALLSDEMGTLICEQNKLLYGFFNIDRIFDFLLSIGMRPFVELSFMPETLASGNTTVFSYRANVTPPKDFTQWADLIQKLANHWVDRYGLAEVRQWFFEVWNEPNLQSFWTGPQEAYFKLYQVTAEALKSVDESLKVGGPVTADNRWIPDFLEHCRKTGIPVDFVSTHHYPTDAFGMPGADTLTQLEHAPRGVLREQAKKACNEAAPLPLYYTEWNISSNPRDPLHDEPFAAAFITKTVMEARGLVHGYSFWTFSDIFSENYFPSIPFQGGFGLLNLHGIPKPAYRAFQLLHGMGTEFLEITGSHPTVDAWVVRNAHGATILMTNLAMPRHPIQTEAVTFRLESAAAPDSASIERIDDEHANPRSLWKTMGEPEYLSADQLAQLETASELRKESQTWTYKDGNIEMSVTLPPQSTAAITIHFC
jgi:xylan 1,4-beta-xylosidase